jgi:hypothetical protein
MAVSGKGVVVYAAGVLPLFVVGCLFPSFDGMEGNPGREQDIVARGDASAKASPKTDAPAQPLPTQAPSSFVSFGSMDGGAADAAVARPRIACGTSKSCDPATSFCCTGALGDDDCVPLGSNDICLSELHCTSSDQCSGNQVCCNSIGEAKCSSSCDFGSILCNPSAPRCPSSAPHCGSLPGLGPPFCGM